MEELQKLVHIALNPQQNYSNEVKFHTQAQFDKIIADHSQDCDFFFNIIRSTTDPYIKFWAIGALGSIVEKFYPSYPVSLKQSLHESYFALLESSPAVILTDTFIENRYALLFISIVKIGYPADWPDAFKKLLGLLDSKAVASDFAYKIRITDFILTALIEFDREIVEFYENKTQEDFQRSREIKEEMRKKVVADIVFLLSQILDNADFLGAHAAGQLVTKSLVVSEKFIAWTSVETFLERVPKYVELLGNKAFQVNAAKCIYALLEKGMEPIAKLSIIEKYHLLEILAKVDISSSENEEYAKEVSLIINRVGLFFLECSTGHEDLSLDIKKSSQENFYNVLQLACKCLDSDSTAVSLNVVELINQYVNSLRREPELTQIHMNSLTFIVQLLVKRIQYPPYYSVEDPPENASDEPYIYYRNELNSILANMLTLPTVQKDLLNLMGQIISNLKLKHAELTPHQREAALYILFRIGEPLRDITMMLKSGTLGEIMNILIDTPQIFSDLPGVVCVVMEIMSRYAQYFENHEAQAEIVVAFFLSDKGIFSANSKIASKAATEFARFNERLKTHTCLTKHYPNILAQLKLCIKETLAGHTKLTQDNLQSVYQTVGTILGHKSIPNAIRIPAINELMEVQKSLLERMGHNQKATDQTIKTLTHLVRGFDYPVSGDLKEVLGQLANSAVSALNAFPANSTIRDSVVLLFNKLVVAIGADLTPLVKQLMQIMISHTNDTGALNAVIKLCTLAVSTWKDAGVSLASEIFHFLFASILAIGYPAAKISDLEKAAIDVVHSFMKLLKAIITARPEAFFALPLDKYKELMLYLSKWAYSTLDEALRKVVIGIFAMILGTVSGVSPSIEGANQIITAFVQGAEKGTLKAPILMVPEYASHASILIETTQMVAMKPLEILSPFNAVDMQSLTDISALHFLLHKILGPGFLTQVQAWAADVALADPKPIQETLEGIAKGGALRDYKETLRKVLVAKAKAASSKR